MRIIARNTIVAFGNTHPAARASLDHWYRVTAAAEWATTSDVQASFSKAKVLNAERVRFEIAGGDFRLICAFDFRRSVAFIKFVGTHAEYDRIDALTVSQF
ncbi:type II toxin-antitoxin system HigB family toxin [Yangia mangrovi]|uniref:Type II toxin-antitoxin system HigB family toxin n=1 Tax=Alloyangia mangrovi TaxID=1779329 RepID=A0A2A3K310_9RHOB|nr:MULTISPECIES: type II toxin-antitoxin system HigB family toxin [Roseobacteraceae]MCT4369110.1 type II toxin-antitoxin system HigB family toxin [Alloyangia mangrovi]NDV52110.1 type II toxin-antitoxin system HigB family toxin [Salipiger sp. PrR003]